MHSFPRYERDRLNDEIMRLGYVQNLSEGCDFCIGIFRSDSIAGYIPEDQVGFPLQTVKWLYWRSQPNASPIRNNLRMPLVVTESVCDGAPKSLLRDTIVTKRRIPVTLALILTGLRSRSPTVPPYPMFDNWASDAYQLDSASGVSIQTLFFNDRQSRSIHTPYLSLESYLTR